MEEREWILEKISNHRHKGEIVIMTIDGIRVAKIEDIIKQPVEGLLYDLNRDDATLGTLFRTSGDPKYINDMAIANIVKYLMKKLNMEANIKNLHSSHRMKWEYKTIVAGRGGGIIHSQLESMRSEGWMLESQNGLEYIFKRKIQEE